MSISLGLGAPGPEIWSLAYLVSHDEIGNPPFYDWNMPMVSMSIDAVTYDRQAVFALEDGTAAGIYSFGSWDPMYLSAPRASVFDGEVWHNVVGSCVRPGQGVFATSDGTFWSSWVEGNTLRWGSFVPVD